MITLQELYNDGVKYVLITIDDTRYWNADIVERAEKIESVYLVNLDKPTYLCSLSISFPAIHFKNVIQNTESFNEDELCDIERNEIDEDVVYLEAYTSVNVKKVFTDLEMSEDEIIEDELCNPIL